jgi:hypothetical protein
MHTVEIPLDRADLRDQMSAMRAWLERAQVRDILFATAIKKLAAFLLPSSSNFRGGSGIRRPLRRSDGSDSSPGNGAEHCGRRQGRRSETVEEVVSLLQAARWAATTDRGQCEITGRSRAHAPGGRCGPRNPALVTGRTYPSNYLAALLWH